MNVRFESPQQAIDRARRLISEGKVATIEEILTGAAQQFPESDEVRSHLSYFYYKTNQFSQAIEVLLHLSENFPGDPAVCRMLSDCYAALGQHREARRWLRLASNKRFSFRIVGTWILDGWRSVTFRMLHFIVHNPVARFVLHGLRLLFDCVQYGIVRLVDWCLAGVFLPEYQNSKYRFHRFIKFLRCFDREFLTHVLALHKNREIVLTSCRLPDNPQADVLDIGTGNNPLPLYWSTLGYRVTALDGSLYGFPHLKRTETRLSEAGHHLDIRYAAGDMLTLPFQDGSFDYVTSICAIEHIPGDGDMASVREMYRVLKPGGRAAITLESNGRFLETWMEVPYERGYQSGMDEAESTAKWQKVFCRNYTLDTMNERIVNAAAWTLLESGFYDNRIVPARVWLDPIQHPILSKILHPFSPLLSIFFYRPTAFHEDMSTSSIGYVILEKT